MTEIKTAPDELDVRPHVSIKICVEDHTIAPKIEWVLRTLLSAFGADVTVHTSPEVTADIGYGAPGKRHQYPYHPQDWEFGRTPPSNDQIAMCFWWLSRMEEVIADHSGDTSAFDDHQRFRYAASALAEMAGEGENEGEQVLAPVDDVAAELARHLGLSYRSWTTKHANFAVVLTHDIDIPRRWDRIGIRRGFADAKRQLRRFDIASFVSTCISLLAIPIWRLRRNDPYTNARKIGKLESKYHTRSTSFAIARHRHPADGNAVTYRSAIGRYARDVIATGGELGLHGSYTANTHDALADELDALAQITGADIAPHHRFHYLRHTPPTAWPELEAAGLATDASLGYAEMPGFRAGWSRPYHAWDHQNNRPLGLLIIPLVFMDATLEARYLNTPPRDAAPLLDGFIAHAKAHHSCFSVLWHNDKLCAGGARPFTKLYKHVLRAVVYHGGAACAVSDVVKAGNRPQD